MSGKKWGPDLAALRHRDFALYVSANFLTTIALQIQATALAFQIYAITGDMFQLGLVGLAEFLPAALLALPAGHLADRIDRRLLILIGVTAELLAASFGLRIELDAGFDEHRRDGWAFGQREAQAARVLRVLRTPLAMALRRPRSGV